MYFFLVLKYFLRQQYLVGGLFAVIDQYQLRYISDEVYARQILEQLNKGEARYALCRNIFYGRKGKLYQTYLDGMEEQLTALSLVTNAVIYWNPFI